MSKQAGSVPQLLIIAIVIVLLGAFVFYIKTSKEAVYTDTQSSPSPSSQTPQDTPEPKTDWKTFEGTLNNWTFQYPADLGNAKEGFGYKSNGNETKDSKERWWNVRFDKFGFEPGYFSINSTTENYIPENWEGSRHWFNTKLTSSDNTETVKEKLIAERFNVLKVEETENSKGTKGYAAYVLNCHGGCGLERLIIMPLSSGDYSNLVILAVLIGPDFGPEKTENHYREEALTIVDSIESSGNQKFIDWQDGIFDSMTSK